MTFSQSPSVLTYQTILLFGIMVVITLITPCKNRFGKKNPVVLENVEDQDRNLFRIESTKTQVTNRTVTSSSIQKPQTIEQILIDLSLSNMWKEFIQPYEGELGIFNGWRSWSFIMVQFGTFAPIIAIASNLFELLVIIKEFLATILISSFYSIDVFLWMSGFFLVVSLKEREIQTKRYWWIPYRILKRAYRFLPSYLFVIFFFTYVLPFLGSGSRWFLTGFNNCPEVMWQNLLLISNFYPNNQCVIWGWYLACEFQLFCVGIILLLVYQKNKLLGRLLTFLILSGALTIQTIDSFKKGYFIPYYTFIVYGTTIQNSYIVVSYLRAPPYFFGMILGMLYYERKNPKSFFFKLQKCGQRNLIKLSLFSYVFGFGIVFYLCFGWYDALLKGKNYYPETLQRLYWAFCRLIFVFGVTLISLPSLLGFKDKFNETFMNNYGFQILAKLSFSAYLCHYMIQMFVWYNFYEAPNMSTLSLIQNMMGILLLLIFQFRVLIDHPTTQLPAVFFHRATLCQIDNSFENQREFQFETETNQPVPFVEIRKMRTINQNPNCENIQSIKDQYSIVNIYFTELLTILRNFRLIL